ncbi:MAG: DnaD domain protein, partial [Catenibacillus sp.]|nr:DnaD domain protein [Catenibacillus sp.]
MKLKIHSKVAETATVIPNIFFDTYMPKANGEFLKVYLYLYRWHTDSTKEISIASVADTLDLTEGDVIRALKYWQEEGLLALMTDQTNMTIEEIIMLPLSSRTSAHTVQTSGMMKSAAAKAPDFSKPSYTMNEIQNFSVENDGDKLFFVIGQYLGRPLSQTDTNTIVFFHERLGFSIDLIEYLFEYCVSNNHRSIHYIEKVAISWAEKGIQTVSAAKAQSTAYN